MGLGSSHLGEIDRSRLPSISLPQTIDEADAPALRSVRASHPIPCSRCPPTAVSLRTPPQRIPACFDCASTLPQMAGAPELAHHHHHPAGAASTPPLPGNGVFLGG